MADGAEDVQPLVCDNGSGMVKVRIWMNNIFSFFGFYDVLARNIDIVSF